MRQILRNPIPIIAFIVLIGIISYLFYEDFTTPKIVSVLYVDTSDSNQNQRFKEILKKACEERANSLRDDDDLIDNKFADVTGIPQERKYLQRDKNKLKEDCGKIQERPDGLGNRKGTDLGEALKEICDRIRKYEGEKSVLMIFVNANETVVDTNEQEEKLRKSLADLSNFQGQAAIFVSDFNLIKKLIGLTTARNVQIRSYEDAYQLIPQMHQDVRQLAKQK